MQQIAALLGTTCCTRLPTLLKCVATCCDLKIYQVCMPGHNTVALTWPNNYNIMQHPQMLHEKCDHFQIWANNTKHVATHRNTSQQGSQTYATCCTQQCCDTLHWNVAIAWPGLNGSLGLCADFHPTMKKPMIAVEVTICLYAVATC